MGTLGDEATSQEQEKQRTVEVEEAEKRLIGLVM